MIEVDGTIRCDGCGKKLAEYKDGVLYFVCQKNTCHRYNSIKLNKDYVSYATECCKHSDYVVE